MKITHHLKKTFLSDVWQSRNFWERGKTGKYIIILTSLQRHDIQHADQIKWRQQLMNITPCYEYKQYNAHLQKHKKHLRSCF